MSTSSTAAPAHAPTRPGLKPLAAAALLCAVLAALAAVAVGGLMSSYVPYTATQVLGIVPTQQSGADSAVAAANQWANVGGSAPFQHFVAGETSVDEKLVAKNVKVTSDTTSPTLTVTVSGENKAQVSRLIQTAVSTLESSADRTDPRFPLKELTDVSVAEQPKPAVVLPAAGAGVAIFLIGMVAAYEIIRRLMRRRSA